MPTNAPKKILGKIRGYLRENWGVPFIIGFMQLLAVSAVSLAVGLDSLANDAATLAYYALVVGIALQLVSSIKHRKRG